jgi:hypothetical protein
MGPQHYNEVNLAEVAATRGWIDEDGSVPVKMSYTGFRGFDSFVGMYVAAFTPGMAGLDESECRVSNLQIVLVCWVVPGKACDHHSLISELDY